MDSKQETKQGLYIYQTSGIIGDQDIYATNNGIKIVNKSSGLVTVAAAPDWIVTTYHDNSRLKCQVPLSSFSGYIPKAAFEETGCRWDNLPLVKSEVKEVANLPSQVYTTSNNFTEKQLKDWQLQFADSKFIKSARYCVSSNLKLPDKALSVLCKFYGLAKKGGVPLEFKYHDLGGNLHTGLITTSQRSLKAESISLKAPEGMFGFTDGSAFLQIRKVQNRSAMFAAIYVRPELRNRGLGHALLHRAFEYLKDLDMDTVRLNVFSNNRAQNLYRSMGFLVTGSQERKLPDGNLVEKRFMEKSLR